MSWPAAAAEPDVGARSATLIGPASAERVGDGTPTDRIASSATNVAAFALMDILIVLPPFVCERECASDPQVLGSNLFVGTDSLGIAIEDDVPFADDVGRVGDRERQRKVLLDEHDRQSGFLE